MMHRFHFTNFELHIILMRSLLRMQIKCGQSQEGSNNDGIQIRRPGGMVRVSFFCCCCKVGYLPFPWNFKAQYLIKSTFFAKVAWTEFLLSRYLAVNKQSVLLCSCISLQVSFNWRIRVYQQNCHNSWNSNAILMSFKI